MGGEEIWKNCFSYPFQMKQRLFCQKWIHRECEMIQKRMRKVLFIFDRLSNWIDFFHRLFRRESSRKNPTCKFNSYSGIYMDWTRNDRTGKINITTSNKSSRESNWIPKVQLTYQQRTISNVQNQFTLHRSGNRHGCTSFFPFFYCWVSFLHFSF